MVRIPWCARPGFAHETVLTPGRKPMNTLPELLASPTPRPKRTARDICELFALHPAARVLLEDDLSSQAFFDRLVEAGYLADARRFLAYSLRSEAAIWWATLCLEESRTRKSFEHPEAADAFQAVGQWLASPAESTRRVAETAARRAGTTHVTGILASAVFLSGGSLSRPGLPGVYPAKHLCGRLCGVVVYLASVRTDPARYRDRLRQYLQLGREVARGENPPPVVRPDIVWVEPRQRAATTPITIPELPSAVRALFESGLISREGELTDSFFRKPELHHLESESGT